MLQMYEIRVECDGYENAGTRPPGHDSRELLPKNRQAVTFPILLPQYRKVALIPPTAYHLHRSSKQSPKLHWSSGHSKPTICGDEIRTSLTRNPRDSCHAPKSQFHPAGINCVPPNLLLRDPAWRYTPCNHPPAKRPPPPPPPECLAHAHARSRIQPHPNPHPPRQRSAIPPRQPQPSPAAGNILSRNPHSTPSRALSAAPRPRAVQPPARPDVEIAAALGELQDQLELWDAVFAPLLGRACAAGVSLWRRR
jgi:hypothetical protein